MAKTNNVDVAIYSDDDFLAMSSSARWLYVWAFTNPHCNMAGVYKASLRMASMETGLTADEIQSALAELESAQFIAYDTEGRWLWVRTRVKHIRSQNRNVAKAIISALTDLPRGHPFGATFYREYVDSDWGSGENRGVLEALLNEAAEDRDDWLREGLLTVSQPLANGHASVSKRSEGEGEGGSKGEENSKGPSRRRAKPKPVDPDALPDGFPEQLVPVLDQTVHPTLIRVAAAKGALVVTRAAVARLLATYPRKPHDTLAADFEHYWLHGGGATNPVRDAVSTYRNRAVATPDRAGPLVAVGGGANRHTSMDYLNDREMA